MELSVIIIIIIIINAKMNISKTEHEILFSCRRGGGAAFLSCLNSSVEDGFVNERKEAERVRADGALAFEASLKSEKVDKQHINTASSAK